MLDKESRDKFYLVGRATALTESLTDVPVGFAGLVNTSPINKLPYHLRNALRGGNPELVEVAGLMGDIPATCCGDKGRFWLGYYHQKQAIENAAQDK